MKVSPVSADMLIKLGLGAAVLGAAWYSWKKVSGAAGDAIDAVTETASAAAGAIITGINPGNADNIVNKAATAAGGALVSDPEGPGKNADGSWTVGGWLYDVTHPGWQTAINAPVPPKVTPKPAAIVTSQYDAFGNYLGDW